MKEGYVMKKAFAFLLVLSMIFLIGCSSAPIQPETTTEAEREPSGFVEMNIDEEYLSNAFSVQSKGNLIMFLTTLWIDEENNPVTPKNEEDSENYTDASYLMIYDAKEQRLIKKHLITECPFNDIWGCEFSDDNKIVLYNDNQWKNAVYDMNMNFIEVTDREQYDFRDDAKKSPFYSDGRCTINDGYAKYEGFSKDQYIYFTAEPETLYVRSFEKYTYVCDFYKPKKLVMNECLNENLSITYSIADYKNGIQLNSAVLSAQALNYDCITSSANVIGDTYACVIVFYSDEIDPDNNHTVKAYSWYYNDERNHEKISVNAYNFDAFKSRCEQKITDLKEKYGIEVYINQVHDGIAEMAESNGEIDHLALFEDLDTIREFLESLPAGMVKEIYSGFESLDDRKGIRIDIVSDITIDASAFAQSFSDPMEICFTFSTVSTINVAHEFMHLFDARIDDYMGGSEKYSFGLYDEWVKFNEGFESKDSDSKEEYEYDESQFISMYSATNDTEDRAEIFSILYVNADDGIPQLENEVIKNKAVLLCRLIREAFPSCKNAENLIWEKQLANYKTNGDV